MDKTELQICLEKDIGTLRKKAEDALWRALDAKDRHEEKKWFKRAEGAERSIEYCQGLLADLV